MQDEDQMDRKTHKLYEGMFSEYFNHCNVVTKISSRTLTPWCDYMQRLPDFTINRDLKRHG